MAIPAPDFSPMVSSSHDALEKPHSQTWNPRYSDDGTPVVTTMDTLKSGWAHYVYYTTDLFSCFLSYLMTIILN